MAWLSRLLLALGAAALIAGAIPTPAPAQTTGAYKGAPVVVWGIDTSTNLPCLLGTLPYDSTCVLPGTGGGGGGGAITAAAGALADGSIVAIGSQADTGTPYVGSGPADAIQLLTAIYNAATAPLPPATHAASTVLASNLVAKNSAGTLYSFTVSADSTLDAAAWYVMIFDATSAPADGTVTPAKCYAAASGQATVGGSFAAGGAAFATGITIVASSTGCFSKTASTHAFLAADYR